MKHRQLQLSGWIRNGGGEWAGILVVYGAEIQALKRSKRDKPDPLPVKKVRRACCGDARAAWRARRISHEVALQRFDERDARVFAASAAVYPTLIVGFRLQSDAETLDAFWISRCIEPHSGNTDARVVPKRHQSWKEVQRTVRATSGRRIQDAFGLMRIARLRLHQDSETLQLKSTHVFLASCCLITDCQTCDDCLNHTFRLVRILNGDAIHSGLLRGIVIPSDVQGIADVNHVFQ